jgi:hypothetical protein
MLLGLDLILEPWHAAEPPSRKAAHRVDADRAQTGLIGRRDRERGSSATRNGGSAPVPRMPCVASAAAKAPQTRPDAGTCSQGAKQPSRARQTFRSSSLASAGARMPRAASSITGRWRPRDLNASEHQAP